MNISDYIRPFWVRSEILCNVEVGQLFRDDSGFYRLLYRDIVKAQVVHWNWWTKLWWGGQISK